jgi:hypothetical protein
MQRGAIGVVCLKENNRNFVGFNYLVIILIEFVCFLGFKTIESLQWSTSHAIH